MYVMIRVGQVGTVVGTHQGVNDNITMFPWSMFLFFFFYFFSERNGWGVCPLLVLCCAVLCCAVLCDDDRPVWTSGVVCSSVGVGVVDRFNDLVSSSIIYI